jgi:hypothetical protein
MHGLVPGIWPVESLLSRGITVGILARAGESPTSRPGILGPRGTPGHSQVYIARCNTDAHEGIDEPECRQVFAVVSAREPIQPISHRVSRLQLLLALISLVLLSWPQVVSLRAQENTKLNETMRRIFSSGEFSGKFFGPAQ